MLSAFFHQMTSLLQNWALREWRRLNGRFLQLFGLSVLNILFMHVQMALTVEFEYPFKVDAVVSNLFSCLIDSTCLFGLSLLLTRGRVKGGLLLTFVLTAVLSFLNVLYSRFFGHYLPNMAILQVGNLYDADVIGSILTGFRWMDFFYVVVTAVFVSLYWQYTGKRLKERYMRSLGWLWVMMLTVVAIFILTLGLLHDPDFTTSLIRFSPIRVQYTQAPNNMLYRSGFVRRMLVCYEDFLQRDMKLEAGQIQMIEQEYLDYSQRTTAGATVKEGMNLVFIIVESYLAVTSDLVVDGKEITPFLNQLKRENDVYYNGHVSPNVNLGESSDGQFIYMTGLLPLKSEITVNMAKDKTLCGLPELLKKAGRIRQSFIVVPTSPTFWEQDAMNEVYGFDTMYSKFDYDTKRRGTEDLNDEECFKMASHVKHKPETPYMAMIVTMSMHNPYTKCVEHGFTLTADSLSMEYKNYLIDCHYFDQQLEWCVNEMKQRHVYDNSVIVITADHDAHPVHLNMGDKQISNELPLYIVHGGIDVRQAWTGPCNQLDVYTTLLDMFGIESKWRGLGHSLLNKDYINSVTEQTQQLSDWIVRSNYFKR